MDIFSIQSLVIVTIGIVAAILGVMFGAAGFVMLPAMLVLGVPIHASVAVNKFATGVSSFTTMLSLLIKRQLQLTTLIPYMLLSALGGLFGAFIATRLTDQLMNFVGCIALIISFISVMRRSSEGQIKHPKKFGALLIGMYDGSLGPGSGSMYITYFSKSGDKYLQAAHKTRFLMFSSCMSAFVFYFIYGIVKWELAIPLTIGAIIGSHIAVKIMPYLNPKWMRTILPVIFAILIIQVLIKLI